MNTKIATIIVPLLAAAAIIGVFVGNGIAKQQDLKACSELWADPADGSAAELLGVVVTDELVETDRQRCRDAAGWW